MPAWIANGRALVPEACARPLIMGVVNATPDSFSDGGRFADPEAAVAHALALEAQGAGLLDIGGESSRPGAEVVPAAEELRRIIPVIRALAARSRVPISVDTAKPEVAAAALEAGAAVINDIGGLREPAMLEAVSGSSAGVVIMHMAGTPRTMQQDPRYGDVVREVRDYLAGRVDAAIAAGIARERIAIDPGIGFGKTTEHNLELLRHIGELRSLGCAVLIGTSRKSMWGAVTKRPVAERLISSVVSSLASGFLGAEVIRVHDVEAMADALAVWGAIVGWERAK
jgi:dihydropteroate synthase